MIVLWSELYSILMKTVYAVSNVHITKTRLYKYIENFISKN